MSKSTVKKGNDSWAELTEKYLTFLNLEHLEDAAVAAREAKEIEISRFLKDTALELSKTLPRLKDLEKLYRRSETLAAELEFQNRKRESLILALLGWSPQTRLVSVFAYFPHKKQSETLELGMRACMEAIKISRRLKLEAGDAAYILTAASGFDSMDRFSEAAAYNKAALRKFRKLSIKMPQFETYVAGTLSNLAMTFCNAGQPARAVKLYREALEIWERRNTTSESDHTSEIAATLHNLGNVCFETGEDMLSIDFYERSIGTYRSLSDSGIGDYKADIARTLNNLGLLQYKTGKLESAIESFDEAFFILRKMAKYPVVEKNLVAVLCNLADILLEEEKDFERATLLYKQALEIEQNSSGDGIHEAFILDNLASAFRRASQFDRSIEYYEQAVRKYKKFEKGEPGAYLDDILRVSNNLGGVYSENRQFEQAEKTLLGALKLFQKMSGGPQISKSSEARILSTLGHVMDIAGRSERSIEYFQRALKIFRWLGKKDWQANAASIGIVLHNLGYAHMRSVNPEKALKYLNEANTIRQDLAAANPQAHELAVAATLLLLGTLHGNFYDERDGLEYFQKARKIFEKFRNRLQSPLRRRLVFQQFTDVYSNIQFCLIDLGEWREALEMVEQGKSRSLTDLLNLRKFRPKNLSDRKTTRPRSETEAGLADEYENIVVQTQLLDSYISKLYRNQTGNQPSELPGIGSFPGVRRIDRVADVEKEIAQIEKQKLALIEDRNRVLREIRVFDKDFPPRAELLTERQIFEISRKSGRVIVIFRVFAAAAAVFIVFPDGDLEHFLTSEFTDETLNRVVEKWSRIYSTFLAGHKDTEFVGATSNTGKRFQDLSAQSMDVLADVYNSLLEPVEKLLGAKKYTEILFVPNKALAVLPLHACFRKKNKKIHYLLDRYTISYSTTVSVFKQAWENKRRRRFYEKFLFITNPTGDLNHAETEVNKIISTFALSRKKYRDLRGPKALRGDLLEKMKKEKFCVYHFSCHGNYDWQDAFSSALTLADGKLTLKEVMEINLSRSWLTTLSACKTGLVNYAEVTDEHYGFPLGFIFAGCPSVWATLWSIDDRSTAELMEKAYRFLKDGKSKAEALRLAQLEYKKEKKGTPYSSPFYWAGFQHYGV